MQGWLGDEAPDFFEALARRDYGLRLNPQRGALDKLRARIPWDHEPVPWCPEGLWLQEAAAIGEHPYHMTGVYYSQDPSAMAAARLLDPQPGEWVMDLAAAPGSKATHLAAHMGGEGVLVANDVSRRRTPVLAMNLERMGVTNAMVTNAYPDRLATAWPGLFDAMLVDAPCSGEGTFAWDDRARGDWSVHTVRKYAGRQAHILDQAAPLLRPGGRLLYGTCTFSPEENEGTIATFLAQHPDFVVADLPDLPGMRPGQPAWIDGPDDLRKTGRFWPHTGPGHGHFYALLQRTGEPPDDLPARWTGREIPGRVLRLYESTMAGILKRDPPTEGLVLTEDDHCYVTPLSPPLWASMPVLRPGWWVATRRHGKLYPDHALAMTLKPEDVKISVDLAPGGRRLRRYLNGGHWADNSPAGFILVTVEGFPLGWAKRGGGRVHSRYPVHLRQRRALHIG
jgi:16S rRNA C967 or C1407 C5-methylase (RsmB/RsmF family)/NOL1/NOP2/fmu family ribosome biogenesis protein